MWLDLVHLPLKRKLLKQKRLKPKRLKHKLLKQKLFKLKLLELMKSQRLSRETFGAQFIVRRMRGKGGPVAFVMRAPKDGLISLTLPLKRKLLKQKRLRPRLSKHQRLKLMKSQRLSRETLGAQFIVRRKHG